MILFPAFVFFGEWGGLSTLQGSGNVASCTPLFYGSGVGWGGFRAGDYQMAPRGWKKKNSNPPVLCLSVQPCPHLTLRRPGEGGAMTRIRSTPNAVESFDN